MKRIAVVLVAGAAVYGLIQVLPTVRYWIATWRHVRQAAPREPGAREDWQKEFGDPDRTLAAFPDRDDDEVAIRLIALARPLGVDLTRPANPTAWTRPRPREAFESSRAVGSYVEREVTRPGGEVEPPPDVVRSYLEKRTGEIREVVALLLKSEPPSWKVRVSLGYGAPIPNLLGLLRLQRVLAAEALNQARAGRADEVEQVFQASWNLNASLRDRPDLISQLIAVGVVRMQAGLARRIPLDPARWRRTFAEHDYRSSLLRSIEVESIGGARTFRSASAWDRASRADFLDSRRALLVLLRDAPVSDGEAAIAKDPDSSDSPPLSPGAVVESISMTNLASAMRRVDRLTIDLELTDRILQARAVKAALGRWPDAIPGLEASRMPGEHWTYVRSADGRVTISFSRELHWDDQRGWMLPLRFESN
jgi:hypothetical protein